MVWSRNRPSTQMPLALHTRVEGGGKHPAGSLICRLVWTAFSSVVFSWPSGAFLSLSSSLPCFSSSVSDCPRGHSRPYTQMCGQCTIEKGCNPSSLECGGCNGGCARRMRVRTEERWINQLQLINSALATRESPDAFVVPETQSELSVLLLPIRKSTRLRTCTSASIR